MRDPRVLADALSTDWSRRHTRKRRGRAYAGTIGARSVRDALSELRQLPDLRICLAGASALGALLVGVTGPITLYADGLTHELAKLHGLRAAGSGRADVLAWEPLESGVFLEPRATGDLPATNDVVTWLDAATSGDPRQLEAAAERWSPA